MTFTTILDKYRREAFSERDKGDRFERLIERYLLTDPVYTSTVKDVWLWGEFFAREQFGKGDVGIDLVALTYEGEFWAIQCKFYAPDAYIEKAAVDSFLSTSGRSFKDNSGKEQRFAKRLWVSTTNKWSANATEALQSQQPPVTRLNLHNLQEAPVDWEMIESGLHGSASRTPKKSLRPHQIEALQKTHEHFKTNERGKLIMACGTGKTFTALRIAENETGGNGLILFLVPSIALLGQGLREWTADANEPIKPICICSDPKVSRKRNQEDDTEQFSIIDLAFPASTDVNYILQQLELHRSNDNPGLTVVFSTYQSIEVIAEAQREMMRAGMREFDLIICDEAHRTTGVTLSGEDESAFTKVHNNDFLKAKKRLYMTATPRLYSEDALTRAKEADASLCSMDDLSLYGEEMYRIGFGEAVEKDLLTDYKVLILTLNEGDVPPGLQRMVADDKTEINADDASKLIGCINALSKQIIGDEGMIKTADPAPMRRAVAFCPKIKDSKRISGMFNTASEIYRESLPEEAGAVTVQADARHIDGAMSATERDDLLSWLKAEVPEGECRVLTNVRCLSEGVDVPSLDAVMFLSARNSQVDVVQSVGRVMRKAPGKQYGYIIIPVVVPSFVDPNKALDDNERFKVVWTVLNALRAHDDRFNALINKIELNRKRPQQIIGASVPYTYHGEEVVAREREAVYGKNAEMSRQLAIQFEELQNVVFARMVKKVGDRRYWEQWAQNVAEIAERQIDRITRLVRDNPEHSEAFGKFLAGLQRNINPGIDQEQAIEMLSQHIITKPVFEALFDGYSFVKNNPISTSMQSMLDLLESQAIEKDTEALQKFYDSVRKRASGIDNAEGRQRIIIELYDKFFKTAFPKMVEKLGIVYTPVEVVDFIIHSANDVLKKEFGRSLSDENIHILDPFTGTGTFITRLIHSGIIEERDLLRKYERELHANEIVLLAYYIAAVNIENAFHDAYSDGQYRNFEGICLTDTFQLGETSASEALISEMFPANSERVARQKKAPLRVIIGNPPYSVGQNSANDNAQNQKYEKLNSRIANTYAALTSATNKNSLYDSYIKAFRWSTDRLDSNGGIICFVSNGAWIDGNSSEGFRKSLEKEFSSIYVFNLRGNQRTSGELSRKEGGKIFGSGSRTPIAITLLVKNPAIKGEKARIHYHDIGDYLSREDKLSIVKEAVSVESSKLQWKELQPNEHGDWVSERSEIFYKFYSMTPDNKYDFRAESFFIIYSLGAGTSRDSWSYNYSIKELEINMNKTISFYNNQINKIIEERNRGNTETIENIIDRDSTFISWSSSLIPQAAKCAFAEYNKSSIRVASYRPFNKSWLYYGDKFIHRRGQFDSIFPNSSAPNMVICVSSNYKDGSVLIASDIPDLHLNGDTQAFPMYYYEDPGKESPNLFEYSEDTALKRRDGISDFILSTARKQYKSEVSKEDIFFYVYGLLHSPDYRSAFANDLKRSLPRLPLLEKEADFWAFSQAGRKLADLHLKYEQVPPYPGAEVSGAESGFYRVEKMRFRKKGEKDTILYNSAITVSNIPARAYEYVVNGKSAIEWVMERYQISTHKESNIINNPNAWGDEVGNPRYILDLLLSVINVSVQTVEIVEGLPRIDFET